MQSVTTCQCCKFAAEVREAPLDIGASKRDERALESNY